MSYILRVLVVILIGISNTEAIEKFEEDYEKYIAMENVKPPDDACFDYDKANNDIVHDFLKRNYGHEIVEVEYEDKNGNKVVKDVDKGFFFKNTRPSWESGLLEHFQRTHFGVTGRRCSQQLSHLLSWKDIRCILDKLFEDAYLEETKSEKWVASNYQPIRDFLELLSYPDEDAYVNYGPWMPPLRLPPHSEWTNNQWWKVKQRPRKFWREQDVCDTWSEHMECINSNSGKELDSSKNEYKFASDCKALCQLEGGNGCCSISNAGCYWFENAITTHSNEKSNSATYCQFQEDRDSYLSKELKEMNDEYIDRAMDCLPFKPDDSKYPFYLNFHKEIMDDDLATKRNIDCIKAIRSLANSFPANLRYGDAGSNMGNQEYFDPMGGEDGTLTIYEEELITDTNIKKLVSIKDFPEVDEHNTKTIFYQSATGHHEKPDFLSTGISWYIKTRESMEVDNYYHLEAEGKLCDVGTTKLKARFQLENCAASCLQIEGCNFFFYSPTTNQRRCEQQHISGKECPPDKLKPEKYFNLEGFNLYKIDYKLQFEEARCQVEVNEEMVVYESLGNQFKASECVEACRKKEGCKYFSYGRGGNQQCRWEKLTDKDQCSLWEYNKGFDFYEAIP